MFYKKSVEEMRFFCCQMPSVRYFLLVVCFLVRFAAAPPKSPKKSKCYYAHCGLSNITGVCRGSVINTIDCAPNIEVLKWTAATGTESCKKRACCKDTDTFPSTTFCVRLEPDCKYIKDLSNQGSSLACDNIIDAAASLPTTTTTTQPTTAPISPTTAPIPRATTQPTTAPIPPTTAPITPTTATITPTTAPITPITATITPTTATITPTTATITPTTAPITPTTATITPTTATITPTTAPIPATTTQLITTLITRTTTTPATTTPTAKTTTQPVSTSVTLKTTQIVTATIPLVTTPDPVLLQIVSTDSNSSPITSLISTQTGTLPILSITTPILPITPPIQQPTTQKTSLLSLPTPPNPPVINSTKGLKPVNILPHIKSPKPYFPGKFNYQCVKK
uniref:integumentary mucin C.1-like n=1 Tax=Ciona intestinalis TaxID=7719 RepID=UPI000EF5045B|nr:integumentary mucin C.1-like [Ciona intestinalis]|eukprot:XP_026692766.1 integumentary mucin C.1-like [Ciona intestinalis]